MRPRALPQARRFRTNFGTTEQRRHFGVHDASASDFRRSSDMKLELLAALAVTAVMATSPAPAAAQHHRVVEAPPHHGVAGDHHFHRGFDNQGAAIWGSYDLQSSYDDRDWAPESANDWWHDRPDRAYPRWVQDQHARGTCDPDRIWWSGSGWHC
jgi:hypothetical protein